MERNVVFSHKLNQFHVVRRLPPLLPFGGVVGRDGDVPNRSIKPHIKYLKAHIIRKSKPQ
jgi:hypothetical protein